MRFRTTTLAVLIVAALALAACGTATPPAAPSPAEQNPTAQPEPTPAADVAEENEEVIETIFVAPELKDCVGVAPMRCMQVASSPDGPWNLFYDQIEGFTFEEGYAYELKVQKETIANPPADGSSLRYTLVEVVSKTPTAPAAADDLAGTSWNLSDINGATPVTEGRPTDLSFSAEGRLAASAGCNRIMGGYTASAGTITVSQLASTMMACPDPLMEQERIFMQILEQAASYSIDGDSLTITAEDGRTLGFTRA